MCVDDTDYEASLIGLIELMEQRPSLLQPGQCNPHTKEGVILIPAIFTTAKLYGCDCILSRADLQTGEIDITDARLVEKPWVYFQYHVSPGIRHTGAYRHTINTIADALDYEYVRTIPIVSAHGIKEFLQSFRPWETGMKCD